MRIASTKSDESLEQLVHRVYTFAEKPSKARVKAVAGSLAKANPFLRKLGDVPAGTRLIVPPLEDAAPAETTSTVDAVAAGTLLGGLGALVEQATKSLVEAVEQDAEETKSSISALRLKSVERAAADAGVAHDLKGAASAAKQRAADAKELRRHQRRVAAQIEKDLAEMRSVLGS